MAVDSFGYLGVFIFFSSSAAATIVMAYDNPWRGLWRATLIRATTLRVPTRTILPATKQRLGNSQRKGADHGRYRIRNRTHSKTRVDLDLVKKGWRFFDVG